jgi:hypothetical protein
LGQKQENSQDKFIEITGSFGDFREFSTPEEVHRREKEKRRLRKALVI